MSRHHYQLLHPVVHVGLVAMLVEGTIDLFNRACFNYPTLGDLYTPPPLEHYVGNFNPVTRFAAGD